MTLPPGWAWTTLGEAAHINPRDPAIRGLPDDLKVTFLPMAAVDAKQGLVAVPKVRSLSEVRRGFTAFSNGDVLFAKITPCMENGKAAIARGLENGLGFGSTEFHVLRPGPGILSEWVFYFVRQERFRRDAKAHFAGTAGQLRVPSSFLTSYPIPLASLPEQRRIVAEIEKQFTRLDAGVAALKRVQANLRRHRASVLKAACEGRLVLQDPSDEPADRLLARILAERRAKWEKEQPGKKYVEPAAPETNELPELPVGWCWTTMDQVLHLLQYGTSVKADADEPSGVPVLRMGNIQEGRLDFSNLKYLRPEQEDIPRYLLAPGDILINRTNSAELVGKAGLFERSGTYVFASYLIRLQPEVKAIMPRYLVTCINSEVGRRHVVKVKHQVAGQANINSKDIRTMTIPLPPLPEQHRIVAEVERRLSVVQELEETVAANLARAGRLRQAVLKRAFEGRLVAQDASDGLPRTFGQRRSP